MTIYFIDRRTPGRNEELLTKMAGTEVVRLVKGKVGKIEQGSAGDLTLRLEDVDSGTLEEAQADLVVLATGIVPSGVSAKLPLELPRDAYGFADGSTEADGIYAAGCAGHPCDVSTATKEATAAALKAIQCLNKGV